MDFELDDALLTLQATARRFADEEMVPHAAEWDQQGELPLPVLEKAWELGLSHTGIPEELGGVGLPVTAAVVGVEELARGCGGVTTSIISNDLALNPILLGGSDDQRKEWLGQCVEEFKILAFCLSEPGAGSDVAGLQLHCERDGDDYVLNGTKAWITNGGYADLYSVFATLDRGSRHKGMCAFVIPKGTPGLSPGRKEDKMGHRASNTTLVHFDNVRVPASQRLGAEGEGFKIAMATLDRARPQVAALAVGVARRALEESLAYVAERKAFGQPIGEFQGLQFMLADMAKNIEASRLLTAQAAWLLDAGRKSAKQSAMAKLFATDTAMDVTTDAVQIFGGNGYTKEYPVEKLMRDAKLMQIYEGTNQIQRVVIAREVAKE
ncbi:MAG: acyl-CoA dehydrogenase [Deltaproteobacteria bacterium]|nr:acyl-CoA dehydrogenase [Deltaproteobacteria bacterium]